MGPKGNNCLLKFPPNVNEEVRKIHNLDQPGRLEEALDILEQWIKKQDHILKKDFSRDYLEVTLITCKGSVEKAKKRIDRLCTMKTLLPQYFLKTNAKVEMGHLMSFACLVPLPTLTKDFYRMVMLKVSDRRFVNHFFEYYQGAIVLCEYLKRNDCCDGFVFVNDLQEVNMLDLATKMNTVELQQFISIITEGFGARIKGIHILTQSTTVDIVVKVVKQLLSTKVGNRIFVHKTIEELQTAVPKELLPIEYGGKDFSVDDLAADWIDELSSPEHVKYMEMMCRACTDESLRRTDKFNEEYMGMPGSFRNLSVD
ncbi:uncharacterized protein LOC142981632 [Anticarsia gemmatalis]|uniref:uncharacterized protein LOC142981632 n=1 Tax=Anticarsia gemmatalis TaxID=129554 RepID=UPI003F76A104